MGVEHNCKTSNCAWHMVKALYLMVKALNVKIIFVILFHLLSEKETNITVPTVLLRYIA